MRKAYIIANIADSLYIHGDSLDKNEKIMITKDSGNAKRFNNIEDAQKILDQLPNKKKWNIHIIYY